MTVYAKKRTSGGKDKKLIGSNTRNLEVFKFQMGLQSMMKLKVKKMKKME
jgi:hypothetical protein